MNVATCQLKTLSIWAPCYGVILGWWWRPGHLTQYNSDVSGLRQQSLLQGSAFSLSTTMISGKVAYSLYPDSGCSSSHATSSSLGHSIPTWWNLYLLLTKGDLKMSQCWRSKAKRLHSNYESQWRPKTQYECSASSLLIFHPSISVKSTR